MRSSVQPCVTAINTSAKEKLVLNLILFCNINLGLLIHIFIYSIVTAFHFFGDDKKIIS